MRAWHLNERLGLKVGDWVVVRSEAEVLATLDRHGRLDELPFMPQMLRYCGQRFQVRKRVHKLCCIVTDTMSREMTDTVILDALRCTGENHGGCEMACTILWKEAWLNRLDGKETVLNESRAGCSVADVFAGTRVPFSDKEDTEPVYVCQATQLPDATRPLSEWRIEQYYIDYVSGNVKLSELVARLLFRIYYGCVYSGLGFGMALRWLHDAYQRFRGRPVYPWMKGALPCDSPTPSVNLGLEIGDLIRVKEYREIRETIDENWKNKGMSFHPELARYCGQSFRVLGRVTKLINERNGKLIVLKNDCLILDGATCGGEYTRPLSCPRDAFPYWRQIWLEKIAPSATVEARVLATASDESRDVSWKEK